MKTKIISLIVALISIVNLYGQNIAVNNDGSSPDASALLDIKSTDKGVLVPRMTLAQRDAISMPQTGLMIFQTDGRSGFYYNAGTAGSPSWNKVGDVSLPYRWNSVASYYSPGTTTNYTFIVPAGVYKIYFEMGSGGGGFGGAYFSGGTSKTGGGGGGGSMVKGHIFSVSPGESFTVVVGGRGTNGSNSGGGGTDGTAGGRSYIISGTDTLIGVPGGNGGKGGSSTAVGNGGSSVGSLTHLNPNRVSNFPIAAGISGKQGVTVATGIDIPGDGGFQSITGDFNPMFRQVSTGIYISGSLNVIDSFRPYQGQGGGGCYCINAQGGYVVLYW